MAAQAVLIAVLLVVGAAAAVPFVWLERNRWRRRREATALALGGAVLGGGQGLIAFGLFAATGVVELWLFLTPLLIVAGALLALGAALRLDGWRRSASLVAAAALSVAGSLAGGLFLLAGFAALLASVCYLLAIVDSPRAFLSRLDPRD